MRLLKTILLTIIMVSTMALVKAQTYSNPILSGFYPDPSICRVGGDYYIVNSSFAYFPGLPIFHSKDLANWDLLGYAMDRNEQLDLKKAGVSRGLFAPTIRYHNGTFYIMCTLIDKGGNFIISAKDPKGPWSNPVWINEVKGIDPSLDFIDDKAFIVYNSEPPGNISTYDGHRTIRMFEFDIKTMKVIGTEKLLINGGTDITKKPVWIEGPHLFKKDGWYYLMCAEGGTGYNHSEVIFRTRSLDEPFVSFANNPILTQRQLDPHRKNPVTTTGHADLVETPEGKWFAVFLGCRPYEGDYYNTGRETFMLPVTWKDDWPMILEEKETVPYQVQVPFPKITKKVNNNFNGNIFFRDDFANSTLNRRYAFLRNPPQDLYSIAKGKLLLPLLATECSNAATPAFIGFRQANKNGYAATGIDFTAATENEKAGLLIFQNENHYYFLCKSIENKLPVVQLYKGPGNKNAGALPELLIDQPLPNNGKLFLKIEANESGYSFYYATQKNKWVLLKDKVSAKFLSTKDAGGFVGSLFAMYASSMGMQTKSVAEYDWFEYRGK
jgi:xylan 1,4-beta-xylosidase